MDKPSIPSEGSVWHAQASGLVDKILRERADDIIDMDKAVRRVEAERHHQLPSAANEVCPVTMVLAAFRSARMSGCGLLCVLCKACPCSHSLP